MEIIFKQTIILFVVLTMAGMAALVSEKAGIVNIGIEGIMVISMFFHGLVYLDNAPTMGNAAMYLSVFAGIVSGLITIFIFGLFVIIFKSDHVIAGTIINIAAPGITFTLLNVFKNTTSMPVITGSDSYILGVSSVGWVFLIIGALLVVGLFFALHKTRWGIRIKTSGDNPQALDSAGGSVIKTRFLALGISGLFASIAGVMMLPLVTTAFTGTASGYGFLAIAILVVSQWKIKMVPLYALGFSFFMTLFTIPEAINFNIFPKELMQIVPYILPLIVLVIFKSTNNAPKSAGVIYDKSTR